MCVGLWRRGGGDYNPSGTVDWAMPESATLFVSRVSDRDLKIRGIEVYVDGEFVGNLVFGQALSAAVSPGRHLVRATNRLSSREIEVEAGEGETVRLRATGIALGGIWHLMTVLGTVAYRIELEPEATPGQPL